MARNNFELNGNLYGVAVAHDGAVVNQNIILPEQKVVLSQLTSKLGKSTIIGREKELQEIDEKLNNSNALLLINGIGGVGKSTIASYYLHTQKDNLDYYGFFEGLESFVNELRSRLDLKAEKPEEAFMEALAKLGSLEGKKLLVLDDVKNIEENQKQIERILELKHSGYQILLTSREEIEEVDSYHLNLLSLDDAKKLFNSICEVEDEKLLEEILWYLDYHAFFIEKTAHSIKKNLTPQMLREKFKNGEFAQISVKRKKSFKKFLNQLFSLDGLDDEEILMLKQLSSLPSFEISLENLEYVFQKKEDVEFEDLLEYLCEKGWLSRLEGSYKLHQIIKEYIITNHTPHFEEIEVVVDSLNELMGNSADAQVAVENRENIIYFESLANLLERLESENEKVGTFFNDFGNINYHLGAYKKAEPLYEKALKIYQKVLGEEHPSTATSYGSLAGLYRSMGAYEKAEPLYLKSLKIREKLLGEEHPSTATSYNNLAGFYESMGAYEKAEPLYEKALKIYQKVLGEEHPDMATSYNNLAELYRSMGAYEKAEPLYEKALKIYQKLLGEEHPDTATSYNNLALLYESMGAYEKAEPLHLKALTISEKLLGEEHPSTATSYNNLALLYRSMGAYKKAEPLYQKALTIREKLLGEEHPDTATSYDNLAGLYRSMGAYEKAEPLYQKALKIREKLLGEEHPDTATSYNNLAELYDSMGAYEKAEPLYQKALTIIEKVLGEEHPDTATSYNNLAVFYYGQGDFERAYGFTKKAVDVGSKVLPPNHPNLISSKEGLEMIEAELFKKKPSSPKIGRNDPCFCNSGKKYKKCCGRNN
jgi:tetratricopeptide (TPR) repeat protein